MLGLKFSDLEGLRIAAEMERRGEEFYRRAMHVSRNPVAKALLMQLADDEKLHEKEFRRMSEKLLESPEEIAYYDEEGSIYLSAIAAEVVFADGLVGMAKDHGLDNPVAILKNAIQSEKDSILFYSEMILRANSDHARSVFVEIVRQEKMHLTTLQRMLLQQTEEE